MRRAAGLLPLLLAGCVSPSIDRADRATAARIEQASREARQIAQDASRRVDDVRAAAVADVAERVRAERVATLADVSARMTEQRAAAAADAERLLARVESESAAWRTMAAGALEESAAWRGEVTAWRGEASSLRAAFTGPAVSAPVPAVAGTAPAAPTEDPASRWELWAGVAALVFTTAKTATRLYQRSKGGEA